jgi:predicted ester cyclase
MAEENKAIVQRLFEELWNQGKMDLVDQIIHQSYNHTDPAIPPTRASGPGLVSHQVLTYRSTFPDLHFSIEEMLAEGDKVVASFTAKGTHSGGTNWLGIVSTGIKAEAKGVSVNHIVDSKIMGSQLYWYPMGLLQQLSLSISQRLSSKARL